MRFLCLIVLLAASTPAAAQTKLFQDFRGGMFDEDALIYGGTKPEKYLTRENEGLRLRYTGAGAPPANGVAGVIWRFYARGDFSATVRYEILNVERPSTGNGVGPELYLRFKNANREGIAFGRLMNPKGNPMIAFNHMTNNEEGRRVARDVVRTPTDEKSLRGQFRLVRKGAALTASFAEADAELRQLQNIDIGTDDVDMIRIAGLAGGDPTAVLDLRILDFQLEGNDLAIQGRGFRTPAPPIVVPPAPAGPVQIAEAPAVPPATVEAAPAAPQRSSLLLLAIVIAGLMIPLGLIVAVILFIRTRRAAVSVD